MPRALIVLGLAYGDEGKGSWVDHLVRKHRIRHVVRYNGGVQAHHHTVLADGRFHGFRQFGSGSFVEGVRTLLSRFMLIEPEMLLKEAGMLAELGVNEPLKRLVLSENAPVITPFARLLNQIQEVRRGAARHGSTGFGIGITQRDVELLGPDALYVRDLGKPHLFDKLRRLAEDKLAEAEQYRTPEAAELFELLAHADLNYYARFFRRLSRLVEIVSEEEFHRRLRENDTVFEGAQGVLLDQQFGFFPHVTRSNCTFENAERLLQEAGCSGKVHRIGLLRGYATRHGAGPFATEEPALELPPCHNATNVWQGAFRAGWFDAVSARYALEVVGGVDTLAVTNLDRMNALPKVKVAVGYGGIDPAYFSDEKTYRVLRGDVTRLSGRCSAIDRVTPRYAELPGWNTTRGNGASRNMESYLEYLGGQLGRRVDAYSVSDLQHKMYR